MKEASPKKAMLVGVAVLVGHIITSVPILAFMCLMLLSGAVLSAVLSSTLWYLPFMVLGGTLSVYYRLFILMRWKRWAVNRGVKKDEIEKWAVRTMLVWPKGFQNLETKFWEE